MVIKFVEQERFPIAFLKPHTKNFDILIARNCKGSVSYISENIVRENHFKNSKQNVVLAWRCFEGLYKDQSLNTRCKIVPPEWLSKCDVAFGEECGKQDVKDEWEEKEDREDGEGSAESGDRAEPDDMRKPFIKQAKLF